MVLDSQFFTELLESTIVELSPIIGDKYFWYAKPAHDGGPHEFPNLFFCN